MDAFTQLLQLLFAGLTVGSIYALIALGFVLTYNVTGILNLAQGEFAMLGALIAVSLVASGIPYGLALLGAIAAVTLIGGLFERLALAPARGASTATYLLITIGFSFAMRGLAIFVWGTQPYALPPFTSGGSFSLLGAVIQIQSLWAVALSVLAFGALEGAFNRTYAGKAMQACVINPLAARLVGIDPKRMALYTLAASAGLGALAGVTVAPISGASYGMGLMLGLKAFVAAVIGGLTNAPAAISGAYLIGITEALTEGYLSSSYKDAVSFLFLLIILLYRPTGLFARAEGKRV